MYVAGIIGPVDSSCRNGRVFRIAGGHTTCSTIGVTGMQSMNGRTGYFGHQGPTSLICNAKHFSLLLWSSCLHFCDVL